MWVDQGTALEFFKDKIYDRFRTILVSFEANSVSLNDLINGSLP